MFCLSAGIILLFLQIKVMWKLADFLSSRSETEQEVSMQLLSLQTLHSSTGTIHQAHMAQLEITALELYRQCGDED